MTPAEEAYAAQQVDPEERNRLVLQELPQVNFIAKRIHERLPQHVPLEDMVQAGVIGLMDAMRNYNPAKGVQLRAFAQFRIRGAILDSLRDLDWGSRRLRHKGRMIEETLALLRAKLGRQPSDEELAAENGMSLDQLHEVMTKLDGMQLVGQRFDSDDANDLIESAPASADDSPFEQFARTELRELLANGVNNLSEREQMILSLYYRDELTMREIGATVGLVPSRVSQIHAAALLKLRNGLRGLQTRAVANVKG